MKNSNVIPFESISLREYTEKAYLDYSMYVILDRALPHIGDGLKPVQRRIIYAMSELGLKAPAKFKKAARTIGDTLGKYHPHGDVACYEALVLMAQPFSYRYPLVEGQGNFGSPDDPKSFAAMRYTEARLAPIAQVLLSELDQGTTNWGPNFDGTLNEPLIMPARLPHILLNGTTGIAVGMATDIPSHNLREIVSALVLLLEKPTASIEEILALIPGPDLPTEAEIITPSAELKNMYRSGHGSFRMRAIFSSEEGEIIITALPHQVSPSRVIEQIAEQMQAKKLPLIADLRDESDHENPIRLVIVPRSNRVDIDAVMNHLFATTDLERSYRVNLNMISLNGKPQVKNLKMILEEWLAFRLSTVKKRLQYRLEAVDYRLQILVGLLIVYLNLDKVIHIIREHDEPKIELMRRFSLTEIQVEAILELKLRHLARLEELAISKEQKALAEEKANLEAVLASSSKLKKLIRDELNADTKQFGNARRSPLVTRSEAKALREEEIIPSEAVTIVLSEKGWVRAAKGHEVAGETLSYKAGDSFLAKAHGRSNQSVLFFDSTGRFYAIPAHELPSARGQGEPLTGRLNPPEGATFIATLITEENQRYLLASDAGYGFIVKAEELVSKNRAGKAVLRLPSGSLPLPPVAINHIEQKKLAAITQDGHMLIIPVNDLPELPKGKGNKIIQINSKLVLTREAYLRYLVVLEENQTLLFKAGSKTIKLAPKDWAHFVGERGRKGNMLPRGIRRVDKVWVE